MQVTAEILCFNDLGKLFILTNRADEALLLDQRYVLEIDQKVLRVGDADVSVFCLLILVVRQ